MHIETLKIKNFKLLANEELDLRGRTVFLLGPNQVGKSSLTQAAFGMMPGEPLKQGESKGEVVIQLASKDGLEYTCKFTYSKTNQKPKLEIFNAEGTKQSKPATLFAELFNITDFDIDKFLKLSATEKVNRIKNLAGVSWDDIDAEYKKLYDQRTDKNREADKVSKKLLGTIYKKDLPPAIPLDAIQAKFAEVSKHNENVLRGENTRDQNTKTAKDHEASIQYCKDEIKKLEDSILKHELEKESILNKNIDINAWLLANPRKEIADIEAEQNEAIKHNAEVAKNNEVKAWKDEAEGLYLEINDIERRLGEIKEMKSNQLREAQDKGLLPVKGLSIDYEENELRLNGFPFDSDQINTADKIIAGLEIQAALMSQGQVRIAKFDGSLLDSRNIEKVLEWAKSKDIQLFIEQVSHNGIGLSIVIEEE